MKKDCQNEIGTVLFPKCVPVSIHPFSKGKQLNCLLFFLVPIYFPLSRDALNCLSLLIKS